jgi:UDP-glucuronate 4-epimerase
MLDMQPGDVPATYADVEDLVRDLEYRPSTTLEFGIDQFVTWYKDYFKV